MLPTIAVIRAWFIGGNGEAYGTDGLFLPVDWHAILSLAKIRNTFEKKDMWKGLKLGLLGLWSKNSSCPLPYARTSPKIPFSGFHQCSIVTLRSKLATILIRQGQECVKTL
jgi:hypothetical protein